MHHFHRRHNLLPLVQYLKKEYVTFSSESFDQTVCECKILLIK